MSKQQISQPNAIKVFFQYLTDMLNHRGMRESIGLILLSLTVFTAVALLTHDPTDPNWNRVTHLLKTNNVCGFAGAVTSDLALQWFGEIAFCLPILGLLWALFWLIRSGLMRRLTFPLWSLGLVSVMSILAHLNLETGLIPFYPLPGGVLGTLSGVFLVKYLNIFGTHLIAITLGLIFVIAMTSASPVHAAGYVFMSLWTGIFKRKPAKSLMDEVGDYEDEMLEEPIKKKEKPKTIKLPKKHTFQPIEEEPKAYVETVSQDEPPEHPSFESNPDRPVITRLAPVPLVSESEMEEESEYQRAEDENEYDEDEYEQESPNYALDEEKVDTETISQNSSIESEEKDYEETESCEEEASEEHYEDEYNEAYDEDEEDEVIETELFKKNMEELQHYGVTSDDKNSVFLDEFQHRLAGRTFYLPPIGMLNEVPTRIGAEEEDYYLANSELLVQKLKDFKIDGRVKQVVPGPVITRYEYEPAPGIKISKIANLADDLALGLKATVPPRIALIPGKSAIGIELPNREREIIYFKEVLASHQFKQYKAKLKLAIGKNTEGFPFITDLGQMPHLLIAGATGAGKSVCINTIMMSLLFNCSPLEMQMILIDPKMLELSVYNDIPHLREPVVVDPKAAASALNWAVGQMESRYSRLAQEGVRNIAQFNKNILERGQKENWDRAELDENLLPYLVIIIDELADLMMVCSKEVEGYLMRLAQMARAAGIHLILATQRPSVDVITGVIKANFPCRIAFRVSSRVDSRTIIDGMGAEKLLGKGDMLFIPPASSKLIRLHGAFITEDEIMRVVDFLKEQQVPELVEMSIFEEEKTIIAKADGEVEPDDEYFDRAVELIVKEQKASVSMLQRRFQIGYARAARIVDCMERAGIVGPFNESKPREVLVDESYLRRLARA